MKKRVGKIAEVLSILQTHNSGKQFYTLTLHMHRMHISLICDNSVTTQAV